jgi:RNA methyltransferase, TrmH family
VVLSRARERLLSRLRTRKGRAREGLVLVEGPRAVSTALAAGARFRFAVLEEEAGTGPGGGGAAGPLPALAGSLAAAGVEVVTVAPGVLAGLADTEAPQGILAAAEEPSSPLPPDPAAWGPPPGAAVEARRWPRFLVLDAIQDPGNAGTLIRTAAAFGVDAVVALDGTADPWSAKAVRASAGEAFRIPIHRAGWEPFDTWRRTAGLALVVADAAGEDLRRASLPPSGWALVVGNEGAGPRPGILAAADRVLALPLAPGVESLNAGAAGAVLLWALGPALDPGREPGPLPPADHGHPAGPSSNASPEPDGTPP